MIENRERLGYLLQRFAINETSEAETAEMLDLLKGGAMDETALANMDNILAGIEEAHYNDEKWEPLIERIVEKRTSASVVPLEAPRQKNFFLQRIAAAAVLIVIAGLSYFFFSKSNTINEQAANAIKDISPGTNKAVLTLGNGQQIILDSASNGQLAQQSNTTVIKLNNGMLAYKEEGAKTAAVEYNTLSTPRGGMYQVELPDGTQVWLNAASTLRFPTMFTNGQRLVTLTGEAYFEVAKNAAMPFFVQLNNGTQVQVLGTHFNVMAYDDEPAMTTSLLEGAVQLVNGASKSVLKPGQQGVSSGTEFKVTEADVEESISWKNGYFLFDNATIQTVMRQISRWYDVDVVYEGKPNTSQRFGGEISRNMTMMQVFKIMEMSNLNIRLEGRKLIVNSEW